MNDSIILLFTEDLEILKITKEFIFCNIYIRRFEN